MSISASPADSNTSSKTHVCVEGLLFILGSPFSGPVVLVLGSKEAVGFSRSTRYASPLIYIAANSVFSTLPVLDIRGLRCALQPSLMSKGHYGHYLRYIIDSTTSWELCCRAPPGLLGPDPSHQHSYGFLVSTIRSFLHACNSFQALIFCVE